MGWSHWYRLFFHVLLALCLLCSFVDSSTKDTGNNDEECTASDSNICPGGTTASSVPPSCRLVMAESNIPGGGWGVFSTLSLPRGVRVAYGDVVIQVPDINSTHADGMRRLLRDYAWDSQETGGFYEGQQVVSILPGMGMLANGFARGNVLPYIPQIDEADLTRTSSPGAGAISHYHNYTFFVKQPIPAGGEVFITYGQNWFQERADNLLAEPPEESSHEVPWLLENGWCLDNIKPRRSTNKEAGRGAFATRFLPKGSVIAPAPVVVIDKRDSLSTTRIRSRPGSPDVVVEGHQLLRNYCYGHVNSSLLLYPYSPIVNLINHDSKKANAALRWSQHSQNSGWTDKTLDQIRASNKPHLLFEIVATRDIYHGQEIFLNYGKDWEESWNSHVANWQTPPGAHAYSPAYVMDDVVKLLRTEVEQKQHPYPDNVFTSCFYRYSDHKEQAEQAAATNKDETTAFRWEMKRGLFELRHLRPCSVLAREQEGKNVWFTVRIRNRYGMSPEERIPQGKIHIVNHVPRQAIRFSDKLYTTDQHLENAFRHEIGVPDDIFPKQWMDLVKA